MTQSGQAGGNLRTGAVFLVAVFMGSKCLHMCQHVCACGNNLFPKRI